MIPLADPTLGDEELARVEEVFDRGRLTRGPEVERFEEEFASFCGVSHGVATSNGTTALHTAFTALGLGPGDRIATSPFSFVASANAIRWCGAEPTFVDVDPSTYNIDTDALERRLRTGERIDAVLAVHLFGLPCDMAHLLELAEEYDLDVIEDAAQAHGARYDGAPVGSFGDAACFSFFPSKNMTTGEGGIVVTDDGETASRARQFVEHGRTEGGYTDLGHNFCMSDVAAAIGRAQLEKLPGYNEARRRNARNLSAGLRDVTVETPVEPDPRRHVYHQYTIRTDERDGLRSHLAENDVRSGVYYDTPIHRQPAYSGVDVSLPTADALRQEVLSLPVHPNLADGDVERICGVVSEYYER